MNNLLPIVFLGPSLSLSEAKKVLLADYRPPIRRGDLLNCTNSRYVAIVDGEFDQSFSVTPKEILSILDQGTTIFGASSMGALRAAELGPYGMVGIGTVFEWFNSGVICGDDEVALTFSPMDGRPVTIPFVNIRAWMDVLSNTGAISTKSARQLFRAIRRIFFMDRTLDRVLEMCEQVCGREWTKRLDLAGKHSIPDIKAQDARLVLNRLAQLSTS